MGIKKYSYKCLSAIFAYYDNIFMASNYVKLF